MTETDWWAATDPDKLIDWLFFDARATDRKLRLFSVACCRRVEHHIEDPGIPELLRLAETFADDDQASNALAAAYQQVQQRYGSLPAEVNYHPADASREATIRAAGFATELSAPWFRSRGWYEANDDCPYPDWVACYAVYAVEGAADEVDWLDRSVTEKATQVLLLHDIFGPLPFRDIVIAPAWLTSDVTLLARGIYEEKAFDRMPILADALQDAGCDNDEILTHCRATQWEHVRGCWVIDLLLGKPWREERPATG